jgi:hypothetical protein
VVCTNCNDELQIFENWCRWLCGQNRVILGICGRTVIGFGGLLERFNGVLTVLSYEYDCRLTGYCSLGIREGAVIRALAGVQGQDGKGGRGHPRARHRLLMRVCSRSLRLSSLAAMREPPSIMALRTMKSD